MQLKDHTKPTTCSVFPQEMQADVHSSEQSSEWIEKKQLNRCKIHKITKELLDPLKEGEEYALYP